MGWAGMDLKGHLVPNLCHEQEHLPLTYGSRLCVFFKCSEVTITGLIRKGTWVLDRGRGQAASQGPCLGQALLHAARSVPQLPLWYHCSTSPYVITVFHNTNGQVIGQKLPLLQHHTDEGAMEQVSSSNLRLAQPILVVATAFHPAGSMVSVEHTKSTFTSQCINTER